MKRLTVSLFIVLGTVLSALANETQTWTPKWEAVTVEENGNKTIDAFEPANFEIILTIGANGTWLEITGGHLEGKHLLENFEDFTHAGLGLVWNFEHNGERIEFALTERGMKEGFVIATVWDQWDGSPKPDKITNVVFMF